MYNIKLDQFEGPLDLLLSLIEEQKLDITRVSLSKVADQYLEYIGERKSISLENLADFLYVASKLILIKSKALIPAIELSEDEEEEIKDLEYQLAEYKKFKDIAEMLGKMFGYGKKSFSREGFQGFSSFFSAPPNVNAYDLKKAFIKVLDSVPVFEKMEEEIVRDVITLEEKISHLQEIIRQRAEATFSELVNGAKDKVEVIISFLAMLEMVKQRILNVDQKTLFAEIKMRHNKINQIL